MTKFFNLRMILNNQTSHSCDHNVCFSNSKTENRLQLHVQRRVTDGSWIINRKKGHITSFSCKYFYIRLLQGQMGTLSTIIQFFFSSKLSSSALKNAFLRRPSLI